ncbi:MAG: 30S ribosomal protein S20 [Candidatus Pacebacteria bacterium]|jgi:small subunit ribosomal protein S20|nr:30S ribosomal protein S20 [Candidatus Paceibacterota bacterium]|tara:strand:- start:5526 stop:5783 length:258 start_codon:yes stop_codon:yes gene_type:complete
MAITKSAKKAIRSSARKRVFNLRRMNTLRDTVKEIRKLAGDKKKEEATALLGKAYKAIDKAAKRGVIKKNTAARKKSRLIKFINN